MTPIPCWRRVTMGVDARLRVTGRDVSTPMWPRRDDPADSPAFAARFLFAWPSGIRISRWS